MADLIFEDPRLAQIYDYFEGSRDDLENYLVIAKELNANTVLDVGCGTGSFAHLLHKNNFTVTGLDPAKASLEIAKTKKNSDQIKWILGDTSKISNIKVDLVTMTANVAQVFIDDSSWKTNLNNINNALGSNGYLVFEVRNPMKKAYQEWNKDSTYKSLNIPNVGTVIEWCDLVDATGEIVKFRWTYIFESTGEKLTSDSVLRFRSKDKIIETLEETGFVVEEVRDAPDRPGKEFVFIASKKT